MTLPLVVVEAGRDVLADAARELEAVGWVVSDEPGPGRVLAITVRGADNASRAVLVALAGSGLLVDAAEADRGVVDRLCDDLRRLGALDHRVSADRVVLDDEQHGLLGLLSDGATLGAAAEALHLSRRSADRRLAEARRLLGVESTAAALASYRRRLERLPRPG